MTSFTAAQPDRGRALVHTHTTLDGHDPSKVRTDGEDQTIPARLREIVRQLTVIDSDDRMSGYKITRAHRIAELATIAAELEDEARPPAPRTVAAILHPIATASTEADLGSAWRDAAPSLHTLTTTERQQITEAFLTRLCVISQDDGR